MRLDDLTLEVRDRTLKRVGQVTPAHLDLKGRVRWSAVGEWTITLPGNHGMVPHLSTPGSGIILLGPDGTADNVILSGPTRTPSRVRNRANPDGTYTFSGVTDEIVLAGALAAPDTAAGLVGPASTTNDVRTGLTEALMVAYVRANLVPGVAHASRVRGLRQYLTTQAVIGRGVAQQKSPRFQNLLELLQEMVAFDPALGFRVVQVGAALQFQVLDSRDRSKFVRFDVENGTVTSEEVQVQGPVVTDALVAGQGEGTARTIIRRQTADSILAEVEWGVPFERFVDQRDTDDVTELQQSGDETLLEGIGGTAVKMVPSDDTTMEVGKDWRAGDVVTTVVAGTEAVARVTEVAISANSAGVMAGAALGDVSGFTVKDAESTTIATLDQRVSNLERASAGSDVLNPTGTILEYAGTVLPSGYLWADGTVLNRADEPALFARIGTAYNTGGETALQFRLPNRKGRVGIGRDASQTEFDTLGETGGSKTRTIDTAHLPVGTVTYGGGTAYFTPITGGNSGNAYAAKTHFSPQQGQTALPTLDPYITLNYIIKT